MTRIDANILAAAFLALAAIFSPMTDALADDDPAIEAFEKGDHKTAIALWEKGVAEGDPESHYYLGMMYANGIGVVQNAKKAVDLVRVAAKAGVPNAEEHLQALYMIAFGTPQPDEEVFAAYKVAAEKGDPGAQLRLGMHYAQGKGTARDFRKAEEWYLKAANQGLVAAQQNLIALYSIGAQADHNHVEAYRWHVIVSRISDKDPVKDVTSRHLKHVIGHMSPADKAAGTAAAEQWLAENAEVVNRVRKAAGKPPLK